ncbi:2-polyprenyl-3-methyl-5-hydroxy-6-metoxy-1,4-benz oquinol methylase [Patiriisocius marinistellae]|uniref:2-polyprenyl-3-methyl-5-hydroxy-6-metoxy-1,4-benz oquinol methylase n=1 Tax=Patiriisocius marinistellae TaxID=2494560 RepID=A0A5J4FX15_9FLAO|nr:class I SAM-dependent methyltransferase [Patiriisocius marinistellae]GEQ85858.1 2-polyprenyl-3-methyl-5-hydroxy-6-metoxy-1,4-benz oquinol methylase [Patiriisocius marinistellae]
MGKHQCLLCKNFTTKIYAFYKKRKFVYCDTCDVVSVPSEFHLSEKAEKERYLKHNNNVEDIGYQSFVMPIVTHIKNKFSKTSDGLDFGAGTGPVIAKLLDQAGYNVTLYDPFFHPNKIVFKTQYNYIVCCEVIEHFNNPEKEFNLLKSLLKENGQLICKTSLLPDKHEFDNWFYKNDSTHVIFYTPKSLEWIKNNIGFKYLKILKEYLIFSN